MPETPLLNAWMVEMRMLEPLVANRDLAAASSPHHSPRLWRPASPYLLHPCSRLPEGEGIVLHAPPSGAVLSECTDQGIEQRARNLNDLRRSVVVLLELDQVGRLFVEVDR